MPVRPGRTLLFLDEIPAAPERLAVLRDFFEKMPDLHVIAAGSLLDFALEDHAFSMPVGRVEYLHLGPNPGFERCTRGRIGQLEVARAKDREPPLYFV